MIGAAVTGCNPVGEFRDLVQGGTDALSKEDASYRQLKLSAGARGEASVGDLAQWTSNLSNLKAVMADAAEKLRGKNETKIRANKDVQTTLARFQAGVDEVLGRNFSEVDLKLVPSWRLAEAEKMAIDAAVILRAISGYYETVFATQNRFSGKNFNLNVQVDSALVDTYDSCVRQVAASSSAQALNNYCVSAARVACGHQIDVGCVQRRMQSALRSNICPELKTETFTVPATEAFDPSAHVDSRSEELKDWRYGRDVVEPNPNRTVSTFCPSSNLATPKTVGSTTFCGFGPKVRVYGYDLETRHVTVEIENVRHQDNPRKDVVVDLYAEGTFVGTRVIRPDFGWNGNVYSFELTERAFQENSVVKLQFRDLISVATTDQQTGVERTKRAHWVVEAQIKGPDVPFLRKREVFVTKYTPNTWVSGVVNGCVSATPVVR